MTDEQLAGLTVHKGAGDIIALLEDAIEQARAGDIDVAAIAMGGSDDLTWGWAWKDDAPHAFCRIYTATASMAADMMAEGL